MLTRLSQFIERQSIFLRIGSVALAFLLWIFVVSDDRFTLVIDVPLEARNLSAKKALKQKVPETARVRFGGTGRALFKAWLLKDFYEDFKLVLDLEVISEEYDFVLNEYFALYPHKVVIPNALDIEYIEVLHPRDVHIILDEYLVKDVPVRSKIYSEVLPGFIQVGPITFLPAAIQVAGAKEEVQAIHYVETEPDTLLGLQALVQGTIALHNPLPILEMSHTTVDYSIDIQALSERIISDIPVQVDSIPAGLRVFVNPRTVALTVIGGVRRIESISPEDIQVTLNFREQWNSRVQFYEPRVTVPAEIRWQDLSPRNVELVVTKEIN
ncbi:MAG: YbbR-like domain-containing protein [Fidelibacterota bacterium]